MPHAIDAPASRHEQPHVATLRDNADDGPIALIARIAARLPADALDRLTAYVDADLALAAPAASKS